MATSFTTPAMNRRHNTLDSVGSAESKGSRRRSTVDHIAETFRIAKKKAQKVKEATMSNPWFVPERYRVIKEEEDFDHTYTLSMASRVFVAFEEVTSCKAAYIINIIVVTVLIISSVQYVIVSLPSVQETPDTCQNPACDNDPILCPGEMICAPKAPDIFNTVETACVIVFSIDYLVRVLTCVGTPARISGIIPLSITLLDPQPGDPEWEVVQRYSDPDFQELWWVTLYRYVLQPLNIIDLIAIIPFYIELLANSGSSLSIIRILRLARVVRLVKSGKGRFTKGLRILTNTLISSAPMNAFLLAIALIIFIICGAIGYLLEGGDFKVTEEYPRGAYVRPNLLGTHLEESPFSSVLHGMYWSIVTSTTVGYGDIYPTTWGGRVFACACTFLGIVVIALPVTVLGNHFDKEYQKEYMKKEEDEEDDILFNGPYNTSLEAEIRRSDSAQGTVRGSLDMSAPPFAGFTPPESPNMSRPSNRVASVISPSTNRKIQGIVQAGVRSKAPLDAAEIENAAMSIKRLEQMAIELQSVIQVMKGELEVHRAVLSNSVSDISTPAALAINTPAVQGDSNDEKMCAI